MLKLLKVVDLMYIFYSKGNGNLFSRFTKCFRIYSPSLCYYTNSISKYSMTLLMLFSNSKLEMFHEVYISRKLKTFFDNFKIIKEFSILVEDLFEIDIQTIISESLF